MAMTDLSQYKIAVLLPCYNESVAIAKTICDFQSVFPYALIYVYDNHSTDNTIVVAKQNGAIVRIETHKGKGNVVRRMFADVDADIYVLADGDSTYDAKKAPLMVDALLVQQLDMVVGVRVPDNDSGVVYRRGHTLANTLFTKVVSALFGANFTDIFSGYRIFSRRFVKSFPANSYGFEIETELTIHSLEQRLPCAEIETTYYARPEGSSSKLKSYRDGSRILWKIILLLKIVRPLLFFSGIGLILALISTGIFIPVLMTYLKTHLIPRLPTAILSTGIMILAAISFLCGIILDNVSSSRKEMKRLFYLTLTK